MSKEKQQIVILVVLIVGILGVIIYFNIDRLKPTAIVGTDVVAPRSEIKIDIAGTEEFFSRDDYKGLTEFGVVPVRPMGLGNDKPFGVVVTDELEQ